MVSLEVIVSNACLEAHFTAVGGDANIVLLDVR